MSQLPPLIFDRARVKHNRMRARLQGSGSTALFDEVNQQILERLSDINRPFKKILEIGSRDFSLAKNLLKLDPERHITHGSLIPLERIPPGLHALELDDEALPFADATFDLIISNMNLHAVNDVPGALIQMRRALKPDGLLIAALIGGETLHDFRAILQETEMDRRGGVSPRLSPLIDVRDAGMLLVRAGFALPVVDRSRFTFTYGDSFALMWDLRLMGEGNALYMRDRNFVGRTFFEAAAEQYKKRFGDDKGRVPAVFDVLFLAGWAPDASQQVPLKPGAATLRLADALNTTEMAANDTTPPVRRK